MDGFFICDNYNCCNYLLSTQMGQIMHRNSGKTVVYFLYETGNSEFSEIFFGVHGKKA